MNQFKQTHDSLPTPSSPGAGEIDSTLADFQEAQKRSQQKRKAARKALTAASSSLPGKHAPYVGPAKHRASTSSQPRHRLS